MYTHSLLLVCRHSCKSKGLLSSLEQHCCISGVTSLSEQHCAGCKGCCIGAGKVGATGLGVEEVHWALRGVVLGASKIGVIGVRAELRRQGTTCGPTESVRAWGISWVSRSRHDCAVAACGLWVLAGGCARTALGVPCAQEQTRPQRSTASTTAGQNTHNLTATC